MSIIRKCLACSLVLFSLAPGTPAADVVEPMERTNLSARRRAARLGQAAAEEFREAAHRALQEQVQAATPSEQDEAAETTSEQEQVATSQPNDWKNINEILSDAVFKLPDTDVQEMVMFQTFRLSLRNMACSGIGFEDIEITPDLRSDTEAGLAYKVVKLKIDCKFDFAWKYIFLAGSGSANVGVGDSSASGAVDVFSEQGFNEVPPQSGTFTACETDIKVLGIDFSGNVAAEIFNLFEQSIVDTLNDLLNDLICGELAESGDETLEVALGSIAEAIYPYLEPVEEWRYNVTYPEDTMYLPENSTVYSWNDEGAIGEFVTAAMDETETFLGSLVEDENAPNRTATLPNGTKIPRGYDLGINVLLREYLLEEDRSFYINGSDLGDYDNSSIIASWHDEIIECNMSLVELKIYGLDTFTVMQPFQRIQNFTLQNALSWDFLSFEVILRAEFLASSLENSIVQNTERTEPYEEEIHITVGVEDINTVISVMIALDPAAYDGDIQLGAVLDAGTALPCLLASLHDVAVAGLNVSLGDIRMPTIEGLVSPGLDRLLKDGMDIGFFLYKSTIVKAIPALFQSDIRDLISEILDSAECLPLNIPKKDAFIDIRDLLLSEEEAIELGGSGDSPYGDITSSAYGIAKGMWEEVEEDGTLGLNSLLIAPLTEGVSGVEGRFSIEEELFNFTTEENEEEEGGLGDLLNRFEFRIYDLIVDNLDTVVHPMAILQPINHPYITQSTIKMGPVEDAPINASVTMSMSLDIEKTPLNLENIVSIGFSLSSVEIFAELQSMLSRNHFLDFRIGNAGNASCIAAVVTPPELNEQGFRVDPRADRGLEIRRLLAKISDLQLHIECVQCSPGLDSLPELVNIFDRTEVTDILSYRLPLFLEEVAISEKMQIHLDRLFVDAPHYCPHRAEYNPGYEQPSSWVEPEFKQLSAEASDTIFFTPLVGLEVGFVLLVETHYPWELSSLQPLSGQENFVPPGGSDVVDFLVDLGYKDNETNPVRSYLSEVRIDEKTGEEDLGVNLFVRDFLKPDAEGKVELVGDEPFEFVFQGVVYLVHSLKVRGLDTFTRFDALKPIAPQTILNSMHLRHLAVDVNVTAGSRASPEQYVTMSWGMKDLNATVPIFFAIDKNRLLSLELGHFLNISDAGSCFLHSILDLHFPQILVTFGEISTPTFTGFLPDSGEALKESMEAIFERYGERALKALPIMTDVTTRTFLNTFIESIIGDAASCTHIVDRVTTSTPNGTEPHKYNGYVDFRELLLKEEKSIALGGAGQSLYGDLVRSLLNPIQDEILWVDPETGLSSINGYIGPFAEFLSNESGTIVIPQFNEPDLPNFDVEFGALIAKLSMGFGEIRIENVDTLGDPLALLKPIFMKPLKVENSAGIGLGGRPLKVSFRIIVNMTTYDELSDGTLALESTAINDMRIGLSMADATVLFDLFAKIPEDRLVHFPVKDILNPFCWGSLFPAPELDKYGVRLEDEISPLSLTDIALSVSNLNMTVECISCITEGISRLIRALSSPGADESMTALANQFLNVLPQLLEGSLITDQLDRIFHALPRYCPHHPDYVPGANFTADDLVFEPMDFSRTVPPNPLVFLVSGIVVSLVVASVIITTVVSWTVRRRHHKWLRGLPVQKILIVQHLQEAEDQLEKELNESSAAMVHAPEIPRWIRYSMPFIVLLNMALFFSGHVSMAADVVMEIKLIGESFPFERFYSFAIITSTINMWNAGAKELSVLMLTFSGIWPYVKQIISLVCWLAPTRMISISKRGSIYLWLDALAKWSIIDIFVLMLYTISFRLNGWLDGSTDGYEFLPKDFLGLQFYIVPKWGVYANLLAQIISQISSHFIIHYHRTIVRRATKDYEARHHLLLKKPKTDNTTNESNSDEDRPPSDSSGNERGRLCDASFARPHKGESSKLVTRQIASYGLVAGTVIMIIFIIVGNVIPMTSIEVQGLMSYLKGQDLIKKFSTMDLAALLFNDGVRIGGGRNIAGHILLGLLVVVTVLLVPILQAVALAVQWFKPLSDKQRRKLTNIIEIIGAWQFAEVWILSVIISAWQQGQTSEMVMAEQCADFNIILDMAAYYGIFGKEKAHCLRVEAGMLAGTYITFVACILLSISNSFVGKATFHYFWDKESARKEEAVKHLLSLEEEAKEVGEDTFRKLRPSPVLFTDAFRWLLRPEHLGDRPLKRPLQEVVLGHQFEGMDLQVAAADDKLSVSSQSWPGGASPNDNVVDVDSGAVARTSRIIDC